jgi:transcriptional accessory protein Tex/SPT6
LKDWKSTDDRDKEIQDILFQYIGEEASFKSAVKYYTARSRSITINNSYLFPNIFENEKFYETGLKTLTLMQASKDWEEFEHLHNQKKEIKKQGEPQLTDFDKLLTGIMKVPNKNKEK